MSFTPEEKERMRALGVVEEVQEYYARKYLANMGRLDWQRDRAREARERAESEAEAARIAAELAKPWSNGPCTYCGRDDGFTEIRSMGPIHLTGCLAAFTTVQRRKR